MSLLFDENLSPQLIRRLEAAYPQSEHVELVGLKGQSDLDLWKYAAGHGVTLVSKDNDFRQLSFLRPSTVNWRPRNSTSCWYSAEVMAHVYPRSRPRGVIQCAWDGRDAERPQCA